MKLYCLAAMLLFITSSSSISQLVIDPGNGTFDWFSSNTNTGYDEGRGVLFAGNSDFTIGSLGITTVLSPGTSLTFEVLEVVNTSGSLEPGSSLLARTVFTTTDVGLVDHQAQIDHVSIVAGRTYLIRALHNTVGPENWFYLFDPMVREDVPVNLGDLTLLDGTQNMNTANFLLPRFSINIPSPASSTLIAIAGLLAARRNR